MAACAEMLNQDGNACLMIELHSQNKCIGVSSFVLQ